MVRYEISAATTTTAPPERIFAVLDNFGGWPAWMPAFQHIRVELPEAGRPRLGYRFRLRSGVIRTDMEVIDFTPHSRATSFRISFPPLSGVNRCMVVPLGDGRYRIERVDSLDLPDFVVGFIDGPRRERFAQLAAEFLRALKDAVEEPAP